MNKSILLAVKCFKLLNNTSQQHIDQNEKQPHLMHNAAQILYAQAVKKWYLRFVNRWFHLDVNKRTFVFFFYNLESTTSWQSGVTDSDEILEKIAFKIV